MPASASEAKERSRMGSSALPKNYQEKPPVPLQAAELRLAGDDDEGEQGGEGVGRHLGIDKVVN